MADYIDKVLLGSTNWDIHDSRDLDATIDETYKALVDGTNTTQLFRGWYTVTAANNPGLTRYELLTRWFALLADAWSDKEYILRYGYYTANTTGVTTITPLGDLAGKSAAACCIETDTLTEDWADEDPMTWYLRFNGLSLADGTMNILAIEGIDDTFDVTGNTAPVYTGRMGLFRNNYHDDTYEYKIFRTTSTTGFKPWAADVDPADNSHRAMNWQATFGGSLTSGGKLTSGSGYVTGTWQRNTNTTAINKSASAGLTAARLWDAYEGTMSDTDVSVLLDLFQLRHFGLENSGILEGCLSYNLEYTVAMAESGVTSVLLTTAQGANVQIGSFVDIGTSSRGGQIARANVISKETVTIDGTDYCRVHLDLDETINVTEGAKFATLPWTPGSTERLPGHKDGALYSCTAGRTPVRIAGVEVIDGAYALGLDPLWNSDYNADRSPKSIYTVYQCRDSEKQASSITGNYVSSGTFESENSGWQYEQHMEIRDDGMLVPDALGATSTTFMKSAFFFSAGSGVRSPWRFCGLHNGGVGGLVGAFGDNAPGSSNWAGRPRLSGSGKKRGEWAA